MAAGHGTSCSSFAYGLVYLACTLGVAIALPRFDGSLSPLLPPEAGGPLPPLILALPALLGAGLQLAGRRLWTWPYLYLLSLYLVHTASGIDTPDRLYLYSSQLAAILTVALAEILGLSLGRWLNRPSAIGYFCAVGIVQIIYAFGSAEGPLLLWIKRVTFSAAGALFLAQAAIQLVIYRVTAALDDDADDPGPAAAEDEDGELP